MDKFSYVGNADVSAIEEMYQQYRKDPSSVDNSWQKFFEGVEFAKTDYTDKGEVPEGEYVLPIGVAEIKRAGTDVTVVSFGKIIKEAYKAAEDLEKEGISCEVIDLRTVRPLDINSILESVKKTNRLVILEEAWPFGNVSTEITYQVQQKAFDYLDAPIIKINTADTPAPYSPVLLEEWLPNSNDVVKAVKKVLYK